MIAEPQPRMQPLYATQPPTDLKRQAVRPYTAPDYYLMDELLTDEQRLIRQSARQWVDEHLMPIIEDCAQRNYCPTHLIPGMGAQGFFGPFIPTEYGGGGLDYISYGLIMLELERCDSGIRSMCSVQSSLVMFPIWKFGSEEQRRKFLPRLASGEWMGCFGLTEANHGSNPAGMETYFIDRGDHLELHGSKMWISNSPFAQVAVVWAKERRTDGTEGRIRGVIVERGMAGFTTPEIHNKWSLRASATGELVFDGVRVPKENLLPGVEGLKGPMMCLDSARYGISWGALGVGMSCYDAALRYSQERIQFGRPIGGFQLQQKKLAEMITEITKGQLLALRVGQLRNENRATTAQISMAKRNNIDIALHIAREARQLLGGMGITGEFPVMRHMANLESVITYEGTHDIHLLITGLDVTGLNAFKG